MCLPLSDIYAVIIQCYHILGVSKSDIHKPGAHIAHPEDISIRRHYIFLWLMSRV